MFPAKYPGLNVVSEEPYSQNLVMTDRGTVRQTQMLNVYMQIPAKVTMFCVFS